MRTLPALCVALMILSAAVSNSAVVPLSQTREIHAYFHVFGPLGSEEWDDAYASDFASFSDTVNVYYPPDPDVSADATASQTSEFLAGGFIAVGIAESTASGYEGMGVESSSSSHFIYEFEITELTDYELSGHIETQGSSQITLTLDGPDGTILDIAIGTNDTQEVSEGGNLAAGVYTFGVVASTDIHSYYGTGSEYAAFDLETEFGTPTSMEQQTWGVVKSLYK